VRAIHVESLGVLAEAIQKVPGAFGAHLPLGPAHPRPFRALRVAPGVSQGPSVYGWLWNGRRLQPDPREQFVLSLARAAYAASGSWNEVCRRLITGGHWRRDDTLWLPREIAEAVEADDAQWAKRGGRRKV
jgi:hypothetical protein